MNLNGMDVSQFPMGKVGPDEEKKLSSLALTTYEMLRRFWLPGHERGQKTVDLIGGKFFDDETKAEMRLQKKTPIEIPEGYPKFAATVGASILSMKSGGIVAKGPAGTPTAEMMGDISHVIDDEVRMQSLRIAAVRDAWATGCPQFILFDRPMKNLDGKTLSATRPAWRQGFLDPLCRDTETLSDCRVIGFQHLMTKEACLRRFPGRKAAIEDAFRGVTTVGSSNDIGLTVDQRATLLTATQEGATQVSSLGRVVLVELFSMVPQVVTVWMSPDSEKPFCPPPDWDEARIQQWQAQNPSWKPAQVEVDILWVTSVLLTGQVMDNRPHWFQEGKFPIACLVIAWHDEQPITPLWFATQNWKLLAIAKTDHLHSIRLSTDGLTLVREGAIANGKDLVYELTRPGGIVTVKRGTSFEQALFRVPNQREQVAWADVFAEAQMANDRLTVDRNLEGGAQSSQESAKVVQQRVSLMQNKTATAQIAINAWGREITDIKMKMIPRLVTEEQAFRYVGIENGAPVQKEIILNEVVKRDFLGDPLEIINKTDGAKYDVVEIETDDSPTGRDADLQMFANITQTLLPGIAPEFYADFLEKIPNSIAQSIARALRKREEAAAAAPKGPEAKVSVTADVSKASFDPLVQEVLRNVGVLQSTPAPAEQAAMQPGAPPAQPEGAIA